MDDIVLPVPVSELWASLGDFPHGMYRQPTWAECLALSKRFGHPIGELYLEGDAQTYHFKQVPMGRTLKIIMMPQEKGFILRWLDSDKLSSVKDILSGVYHEHLLRLGDQFEAVRSGWMVVQDAGHLRIWG
jgi:hypothetical protein